MTESPVVVVVIPKLVSPNKNPDKLVPATPSVINDPYARASIAFKIEKAGFLLRVFFLRGTDHSGKPLLFMVAKIYHRVIC